MKYQRDSGFPSSRLRTSEGSRFQNIWTCPPVSTLVFRLGLLAVLLCLGCGKSRPTASPNPPKSGSPSQNPNAETPSPKQGSGNLAIGDGALELANVDQETVAARLRYVPPYAYGVLWIKSAGLAPSLGLNPMFDEFLAGAPFSIGDVEHLVMCVYPDSSQGTLALGITIELTPEVKKRPVIQWLAPGAEPSTENHQVYLPVLPDGSAVGFPSPRTIVVGPYDYVQPMLDPRRVPASNAIWKAMSRTPINAQFAIVCDVDRTRHFAQNNRVGVLTDSSLELTLDEDTLPESLSQLTMALDTTRRDGLWLWGVPNPSSNSQADPSKLNQAAPQAMKRQLKRSIRETREILGGDFSQAVLAVERFGTQVIDGVQLIAHSSTEVPNPSKPLGDGISQQDAFEMIHWRGSKLPMESQWRDFFTRFRSLVEARSLKKSMDHAASNPFVDVMFAMLDFRAATGEYPSDVLDPRGKPLLSWRVAILPWLNERPLFELFRLDEPWDSEHNRSLLSQRPEVFATRGANIAATNVQRVIGEDSFHSLTAAANGVEDGSYRTLALIESALPLEWTRPGDLDWRDENVAAALRPDGSWGVMGNARRVLVRPSQLSEFQQLCHISDQLPKVASQDADVLAEHQVSDVRLQTLLLQVRAETANAETLRQHLFELRKASSHEDDEDRAFRVMTTIAPILELPLAQKDAYLRAETLRTLRVWRRQRLQWDATPLISHLQDPYETNRWLAAMLLSDSHEPAVLRALVQMPAQDVQLVASMIASTAGFQAIAADAVTPLLEHVDPDIRVRAYQLIGAFGDAQHRPLLEGGAVDADASGRQAAKEALRQLTEWGPVETVAKEGGDRLDAIRSIAVELSVDPDTHEVALNLSEDSNRKYPGRLRDTDLEIIAQIPNLVSLDLTSTFVSATGIAHLHKLNRLQKLDLNYAPRVDDTVGTELVKLQLLESIALDHTRIGDAGVLLLGELSSLQHLNLDSTEISNRAFSAIATMKNLRQLAVGNTRITDRGLADLEGHPSLESLLLANTNVTDEGLKYLVTIEHLDYLNLRGTKVTPTGVAELRQVFPNVEIAVEFHERSNR